MLQTVAQFRDASEAHVANGALAAEGIDAVMCDEYIVGVNWLYSDAVGGVKLAVAPSDAPRAVAILAGSLEETVAKSRPVTRLRLRQLVGIAGVLILGMLSIPSLIVGMPLLVHSHWRRART